MCGSLLQTCKSYQTKLRYILYVCIWFQLSQGGVGGLCAFFSFVWFVVLCHFVYSTKCLFSKLDSVFNTICLKKESGTGKQKAKRDNTVTRGGWRHDATAFLACVGEERWGQKKRLFKVRQAGWMSGWWDQPERCNLRSSHYGEAAGWVTHSSVSAVTPTGRLI